MTLHADSRFKIPRIIFLRHVRKYAIRYLSVGCETADVIFENLQPRSGGKPRVAAHGPTSVIVRGRILTGPLKSLNTVSWRARMYAVLYVPDEKAFPANENNGWILWGVYPSLELAQTFLEACWKNPDVIQVRLMEHYDSGC
jgi:hypothetical protein